MASYSLFSPLMRIPPPSTTHHQPHRRTIRLSRRNLCPASLASREGSDGFGSWDLGGGKHVDESMIVLRKRIHEMKMEEGGDQEPPSEWMEWERRYYASYGEDVFEAVGLLQNLLMNSRPSMAAGLLALVAVSVPATVAVVLFHLVWVIKWVFLKLLLICN